MEIRSICKSGITLFFLSSFIVGAVAGLVTLPTSAIGQSQFEASPELLDAAQNSVSPQLRRVPAHSASVVCSEGTWNGSLGCCAMRSGICIADTLDESQE